MKSKILFLVPLLLALPVQQAAAISFSYDFSSAAGLTLNGNAAVAGNVLRLVPSADTQSGTAYHSAAVPLDGTTSFSTAFSFNISTDPDSFLGVTDGFTFLLQNDAAADNALGAGGDGLGYEGISPSVAVIFRGRDPNFIGVVTGGVNPADLPTPFQPDGYYTGAEGEFYGQDQYAWIDYDSGTNLLSVYLAGDATKPGSAIMSATVDIFSVLGSQAYVGFSAGNGGAFGNQDILGWSFTTATVPLPAGAWLLGSGLLGLFGSARRKIA
jgi:hypothetical protein